jgi:hypothetical protein
MEEDFAIEILEIYKKRKKVDRAIVLSLLKEETLNINEGQYSQIVSELLSRLILMESGTPNVYLYGPKADGFLDSLKTKKRERDRIQALKEKAETAKNKKEIYWIPISIITFILGALATNYILPCFKKKAQQKTYQNKRP